MYFIYTITFMKSCVFWDIMPCGPLKVNQHFREICRLYLQGSKHCLVHDGFLLGLLFNPEDGEDRTLHNHHCENLKSYIITSVLFIQVAVLYTVLVAVTLEVNKRWSWWIVAGCICITYFTVYKNYLNNSFVYLK
jgi:hypothetical protein